MTSPEILDQSEFFSQLTESVSHSSDGEQIALSTMSYEPAEPVTARLIQELAQASLRGSNVNLAIDFYARMFHGKRIGPFAFNRAPSTPSLERIDRSVDKLLESGVNFSFINPPQKPVSLIIAGRSHLKVNVVGDRVFLGGPNLHGTDRADLVVDFIDQPSADFLVELVREIIAKGNTKDVLGTSDQVFRLDQQVQMILDCGAKGVSATYEIANEMIDSANERIVFGSQFLPDANLLKKIIKGLKRGTEVTVIGNDSSCHDQMRFVHALRDAPKKRALPKQNVVYATNATTPKFHAKGLVCDNKALVGTHNLNSIGVRLGTPEISLVIDDRAFATKLGNTMLALAS